MPIRNNHTPIQNYTCEVWQSEQNLITDHDHDDEISMSTRLSSTSQRSELYFLIDVFVTHDVVLDDDQDELLMITRRSSSRYTQFMAQKHLLVDNAMSWSMISNILSHMLVPLHAQPFIIHKISSSARDIAARPANASAEAIRLVVSLVAEAEAAVAVAGARVLVGNLEKVDDDGDDEESDNINDFCVICLGEILGGCCEVVARLPCLHCYHEECIVSWFEKSNLCPLCRFEMPNLDCE